MIARLLLIAVCALLSGCLSPEGWKKSQWTKTELVEWYTEYEPTTPGLSKFGYAGSDANYHYFITRPIDSFLIPKVPRGELTIQDERKRSDLGKRLYFYEVDPKQNFRKISGG